MKTEVMKITTYETIMVMLAILTLIMSIICIVIKLLLYIIENNAKNNYLTKFWRTLRQLFYS